MWVERFNRDLPDADRLAAWQMAHPGIALQAMSVHKSKGLEADYTLIGLRGGNRGFPDGRKDDPLLSLVLTEPDRHPFGEERRLFYVALTRARRRSFLLCPSDREVSPFARELQNDPGFDVEVVGEETAPPACPACGSGALTLRQGASGAFHGCSNHPLCDHTQPVCPQCGSGVLVTVGPGRLTCADCGQSERACPRCKTGVLRVRNGKRGAFLGCSNFAAPAIACRFTAELHRDASPQEADTEIAKFL
jgi:DNA helicase-4